MHTKRKLEKVVIMTRDEKKLDMLYKEMQKRHIFEKLKKV